MEHHRSFVWLFCVSELKVSCMSLHFHNKPTSIVAVISITIYTTCIHVHSQISPYSVPLGVAAGNGHARTVERLLEGGALINYQRSVCNSNCVHDIIHCFFLAAGCMY